MTTTLAGGTVRRTRSTMADGRELFYFDDSEPWLSGAAERGAPDLRPLGPAAGGSELRRDPLTGDWVAIASHRNERIFLPPKEECPLCPTGRGTVPSEVPEGDYDVVVFENRFPSLSSRAPEVPDTVDGEALWPRRPGRGRCEVVCFTAEHGTSFADLPAARVRTVVEAWADRTAELQASGDVAEVLCFENRGPEIGVTLHHPHGQIYGYPYLTPRTAQLVAQVRQHREATGGDLQGDLLDAERRAGERMVLAGEHWSLYVPAAARWPVEAHLVPHRAVPDLASLDAAERDELAELYPRLLRACDRYFAGVERLPYIAAWHQAPVGGDREGVRLYLQLFSFLRSAGRLKYLAGSESAAGAWISDAVPERIASRLREVME